MPAPRPRHARATPAPPKAKKKTMPTARATPAPCPRHARATFLFPLGREVEEAECWRWWAGQVIPGSESRKVGEAEDRTAGGSESPEQKTEGRILP
eukprot:gene15083-biopygen3647